MEDTSQGQGQQLKTILIVDDDAIIALSEELILNENGYNTVTVYSGEDAVATADKRHIDLILMDIDLGDGSMSGTDAAKTILRRHDLPIIFLSAYMEPEIVKKTEGITAYGYITKTAGKTVLLASITMVFRLWEKQSGAHQNTAILDLLPWNTIDGEGVITGANRAWLQTFGYNLGEITGLRFEELLHPDYLKSFQKHLIELREQGHIARLRLRTRHKDGRFLDVLFEGSVDYHDNGSFKQGLLVLQDVTNQRKMEESLINAYNEMDEIFNVSVPMCVISSDFALLRANDSFCALFEKPREEIIGQECSKIIASSCCGTEECEVRRILGGESSVGYIYRLPASGGPVRELQVTAVPFRDPDGNIIGIIENFLDITAERQSKRELAERERQYRELASHLQTVREEQNAYIARNLHDDLGQYLTALKMNVTLLQGDLEKIIGSESKDGDGGYGETLKGIEELLDEMVGRTRKIIKELRPSVLDTKNIIEAIDWHIKEVGKYADFTINFTTEVEDIALGDADSLAVFRIVQEALTNCMRHSKAQNVDVVVRQRSGELHISIADDGIGIGNTSNREGKSFGILGMRERASACNGTLQVGRGESGGTKVELRLQTGESK